MTEPFDITINGTKISTFDEYIDAIFMALDISTKDQEKLKKEILKYNDKDKNKIISNDTINVALVELINADNEINKIKKKYEFFEDIQDGWDNMTRNLAELQTFILLKNINTKKCSKFIKSLKNVLTSKIKFVNNILETNIKTKNTEFSVAKKYLKYKNKYINLKKDI
jgi:hypothetical protein